MSIHYRQYTDTFSILNYLQNHRLWRKMVKTGTILSRKSSKDPSWLAMCNVYFRNELPTGLPAYLMPFSIRVTSCWNEHAVFFTCHLCIDTAISNQHVVSFREYSDNRYFRQSITALNTLCKYLIFGQYWKTRNVPVFTNSGMFQYLGPKVYLFCLLQW